MSFSINGKTVERVYQDVHYLDIWFTDGTILKINGKYKSEQLEVIVINPDGSHYNCTKEVTTFTPD
jgi:hypothetical protein